MFVREMKLSLCGNDPSLCVKIIKMLFIFRDVDYPWSVSLPSIRLFTFWCKCMQIDALLFMLCNCDNIYGRNVYQFECHVQPLCLTTLHELDIHNHLISLVCGFMEQSLPLPSATTQYEFLTTC